MLHDTKILLVISGGIAAYKSLDLIRRLKEQGAAVRCVLTDAATHLVAPLAVAALSESPVHTELFSLTDEGEIGHIRLVREADLVLVAPATANLLAKMAHGLADDLASTLLLACDCPIVVAPAMNVVMWQHPATRSNLELLERRGVHRVGPSAGDLACGESGHGRMAEPAEILDAAAAVLGRSRSLAGRRALVTSGPTHELIDPVRYLGNRSSGKQGHAIAVALAAAGAHTVLVSGPTSLADPAGVEVVHVQRAVEMLAACEAALPVDIAVCVAAVADWRVANPASIKLKKSDDPAPVLQLEENPDILASLAHRVQQRPSLVVGFAAETDDVVDSARAKLARKGCDWIVANQVGGDLGVFGGERNTVHLITTDGVESWPTLAKREVARRLVERIADQLSE
jgi:phosphopantothenoylcysteine decarboxylase/phosphopantothenate--cysteine ligase